ncbi:MAG TPA: CAP domain-containing protein, partial [Pirellulaceae bacterium]|nr:CAP domain-containing protein [Pirellulaceae bacterium]
ELDPQLAAYRQQFLRAAAAVIAGRTAADKLEEITQIRENVLALAKKDDLTKAEIVATSDPGLARLKELILVSRKDILDSNANLIAARNRLQVLGKEWELCATLILAAKPEPAKTDAAPQEKQPAEEIAELDTTPSFEKYLVKDEEIATALATPMSDAARRTLAQNNQLAGQLDPEEARCVLDLNLTRNLLGLDPLVIDLKLAAAARDHSRDMEEQKFFDHESPVPGKKTPWDRAEKFGTTASGENIALGTLDGAVVNQMWWHSPGHHRNMLGSHTRVGLGRHNQHWTELFGR